MSNDFNTHDNLYTPHDEHLYTYLCTPTLSCFGSFAMRAIFWEILVKFCTIFIGDFDEKLIPFTITSFCLLQGEQFLEDFAKFLGDFGEKLIPFAVTSFCLLQCEQFLGDFGENLHYF